MGKALSGLAAELGCKRRECPERYWALWRERNRDKINAYSLTRYHEVVKKDPAKLDMLHKAQKRNNLKRRYGLTFEEYENIFSAQGGICALCKVPDQGPLVVDHDHTTGEVRALLCQQCNLNLGKFGDDPAKLRAAADYIERHTKT